MGREFLPTEEDVIEAVMEAQADLQTALGQLRLRGLHTAATEDSLSRALARLHKLLTDLNSPMYQPAMHPEVK